MLSRYINYLDDVLTTEGDLLYRGAAAESRLGIGADGQVLTVSSGLPSWQDAAGGSPGGSVNDIQIHGAGGIFSGGGPTWDGTTLANLTNLNLSTAGKLQISGDDMFRYDATNDVLFLQGAGEYSKLEDSIVLGPNAAKHMYQFGTRGDRSLVYGRSAAYSLGRYATGTTGGINAIGPYAGIGAGENATNVYSLDFVGYTAGEDAAQEASTFRLCSFIGRGCGKDFAQNTAGVVEFNAFSGIQSGDGMGENATSGNFQYNTAHGTYALLNYDQANATSWVTALGGRAALGYAGGSYRLYITCHPSYLNDDALIYGRGDDRLVRINNTLELSERSSDPSDPADGYMRLWLSDGTGTGDAGDFLIKVNIGGTVKTGTLFDYSAA